MASFFLGAFWIPALLLEHLLTVRHSVGDELGVTEIDRAAVSHGLGALGHPFELDWIRGFGLAHRPDLALQKRVKLVHRAFDVQVGFFNRISHGALLWIGAAYS